MFDLSLNVWVFADFLFVLGIALGFGWRCGWFFIADYVWHVD
ncbi:MAG: hypothetical protein Rpha_0651 [Candidatus Ruthia sp. Apha_13_S6]|nr:hypothetical protein [Candidatus Ruthia sp. Apha_13_S6]